MKNYGSAKLSEEGASAADQYDLDNTYYVKERTMSRKERLTKCMLVLVPILAAVILVGGFAYFVISHVLERGGRGNRDHAAVAIPANPSSGGGRPASRPGTYPSTEFEPPPAPAPKEKTHSASCSANSKCVDLGLKGECCPTNDGVTLGCCD